MEMDALKAAADGSERLITWALALAGGSVVVIVSTDYIKPGKAFRKFYLLFLPAWGLLALSVSSGVDVWQRYMAAVFGKKELRSEIATQIGIDYAMQLAALQFSLCFFAAWLVAFLVWWIFVEHPGDTGKSQEAGGAR